MLATWILLGLAAIPQDGVKARVDDVTDFKVSLTSFRSGDSDNPTGEQMELVLDGQTKILNAKGEVVKDAASRKGILRSGAIVIVKSAKKDGKATAVSIQAAGG
jgi:hypothetical protein